jgi:hypothetical protein
MQYGFSKSNATKPICRITFPKVARHFPNVARQKGFSVPHRQTQTTLTEFRAASQKDTQQMNFVM